MSLKHYLMKKSSDNQKQLVDVIKLAHGWATVDIRDSGKIMIHNELINALKRRSEINDGMFEPYDYWLIDGVLIWEPSIEGSFLGTTNEIDIKGGSVLRMSQNSFDHLKNQSNS